MENLKTEKRPVKTFSDLLEENPNHFDEVLLDTKMNLYHISNYFFKQADVPALLKFLNTKDMQIEMNGDTVLKTSVKALSHFLTCYNDYKREFDRFTELKTKTEDLKIKGQ